MLSCIAFRYCKIYWATGRRKRGEHERWQRPSKTSRRALRTAVPQAVLQQVQGCSGEELRKGAGASSQERSPAGDAAGAAGPGPPEPPTPCTFPAPALTQDRAGQQGADGEPHHPGSATWSSETDPPASAPPLCAPRPFIPGRVGQAQSLTSCVCTACLPNRNLIPPPSFLAPADHLIS